MKTPVVIVLEGADGTGKTTAAKHLRSMLHGEVNMLHFGPPKEHPLKEYELAVQELTTHTIIDRLHWGELIYGPLYRGESKLRVAGKRHIDMLLAARGAMVIHCDGNVHDVVKRVIERGDDYVNVNDLPQILNAYRRISHEPSPVKHWSVVDPTREDLASLLSQAHTLARGAEGLFARWPSYVGPPQPKYLLVGDERNDPSGEHWSAFVPYDWSSGRFLLTAIPNPMWTSTGLCNSTPAEGDVEALFKRLGFPRVVALGNHAHDRLRMAGIPHGVVPHPQYVRRFHNTQNHKYGELLKHAANSWADHRKAF